MPPDAGGGRRPRHHRSDQVVEFLNERQALNEIITDALLFELSRATGSRMRASVRPKSSGRQFRRWPSGPARRVRAVMNADGAVRQPAEHSSDRCHSAARPFRREIGPIQVTFRLFNVGSIGDAANKELPPKPESFLSPAAGVARQARAVTKSSEVRLRRQRHRSRISDDTTAADQPNAPSGSQGLGSRRCVGLSADDLLLGIPIAF